MSEGDKIEVDTLNNEEAMTLFSHYAFHEISSEKRAVFENEAVHVVDACSGLPLSIEVIGQYLRKQNHFPVEERMDMWRSIEEVESSCSY